MGFLLDATPLEWDESLEVIQYVREHGIAQFIHLYNRIKDIEGDRLLWGDEVEYAIFKLDAERGTVKLSLRGAEILAGLQEGERSVPVGHGQQCNWVPEWGSWMVEGTPGVPYSGYATDLLLVEKNMRTRRARLLAALAEDEICPTLPCFPLMGVGTFTDPPARPTSGLSDSLFVPDEIINPAPRFAALVKNIKRRRGSKVDIRVPRYRDEKTPDAARPVGCPPPATLEEALEMDEVYMDAMAFGMGCCCLQVTFQARDLSESRHLYDQLAVLGPIMLALTAATPIARGVLLDTDVRWDIIAQSVDDRTPAERGVAAGGGEGGGGHEAMAGHGTKRLHKSRYETISTYICNTVIGQDGQDSSTRAALKELGRNDLEVPMDEEAYRTLTQAGVDEVLAQHIAHLFVRDPLVIYRERVELDDERETDHFENIQSTNWQTVRWKPPPAKSDSHIGWRTEFRSMEVQLTDFENAAFTVFVVLVSRVILYFNLNFYMPISCVDCNMRRAAERDAVTQGKFCFRQSPISGASSGSHARRPPSSPTKREADLAEAVRAAASSCCGSTAGVEDLSLFEIMVGKGSFKGLVPLILTYLDLIKTDSTTLATINKYLDFVVARASGELLTPAQWMRRFVLSHPDYRHDSLVSERIAADLLAKCHRIGAGLERCPELHGDFVVPPVLAKDAYAVNMTSGEAPGARISSSTDGLMAMHQIRLQLQTRRRRLLADATEHRARLEAAQEELRNVETQLAVLAAR